MLLAFILHVCAVVRVEGAILSLRQTPKNAGNGTDDNPVFQFGTDPMRGVNTGGWWVLSVDGQERIPRQVLTPAGWCWK